MFSRPRPVWRSRGWTMTAAPGDFRDASYDRRPIIRRYSRSHAAGIASRGEYGPGW